MTIDRWKITDREEWLERRKPHVTGSQVGAMFGCSPFLTPFALYAEKAGLVGLPDKDNSAMKRGRVFEPAVAQAIREDHPDWHVSPFGEYLCNSDWGLGCTPDFGVTIPSEESPGLIQAKTVAKPYFDEHWQDEPPLWIVLQTLQEMMLAEVEWGKIAALVMNTYDYELHLFDVARNGPAEDRIISTAAEFWADVRAGRPPSPQYALDGEIIKALYPDDNGETIDLSGDNRIKMLLDRREELSRQKNGADKDLKAITAEITEKMGNASFAIVPGWEKVSLKTQTRKGYVVSDTKFRVLRAKRAETERQAA